MALANIKLRATSANVTTQINGITAITSGQITGAPLTHEQLDLNFLELANSIVNLSSTEGVTLANQTTTNLIEGTNLYYTDTRVDTRVANIAVSNIAINAVNDTHIDFGTGTNQVSTADIPEQTNLYFTDARVDNRIGQASINDLADVVATSPSNGDILKYVTANSRFELQADVNTTNISGNTINQLSDVDTTGVTTNSILKYNGASWIVSTDVDTTDLSANTTTDLAEGTNLYYTDTRARAVSIENVSEDTTPQLGGDLDVQTNSIVSTGANNITLDPQGTGEVLATANINLNNNSLLNVSSANISAITTEKITTSTNVVDPYGTSQFTREFDANESRNALAIQSKKVSDMADGFGGAIVFRIQDDTSNNETIGLISTVRDGADNTGKFVLGLTNTGTYSEVFTIKADGLATFTNAIQVASMTTTQRDAISSPTAGMMVYNTTVNKHQGYNGTIWNDFY
jgi:hypothetical protein